ncbi:hypothetical protein H5410_053625 [Solanum commersonii]|uniref:Uncharacterized protein n=1 Tax=Solanum commersonii TaxID=4109 RepID=A0A9J5X6Y3_SOLCO|nr:hypothetical protein H5410_053625 [Solanum commersonii]
MSMLNYLMGKLKNNLLQLISKFDVVETPRENNNQMVPNDVKGHFAVLSVNSQEEPMRFIVELYWLNDPSFLKLLKQTEDEYGYGQKVSKSVKCKLNHLMGKLKNNLLQLISKFDVVETSQANNDQMVPNDVKEGYFAVFSVNSEEEPKRFIVELCWLTDPSFLDLLKQTEDEYGFGQKGVLEVHCLAAELQNILIKLKIGV